jgi:hypothetical protein
VVPGRFDLEPFRTVDVDGSACARYNGQGNGKNPIVRPLGSARTV